MLFWLFFGVIWWTFMLVYALLMGWVVWGALKPSRRHGMMLKENVSLLVPFRNEAHHLHRLVESLLLEMEETDEIILVNDQSDDDYLKVLAPLLDKSPNLFLYHSEGKGKKAALMLGISKAQNDLLWTLDADVFLSSGIRSMLSIEMTESTVMLTGAVHVQNPVKWWQYWERLDLLSLVGSGQAMLRNDTAVMCNGANLVFRKSAFEAVGGYGGNTNMPSGDDVFLMQKLHAHFPKGVRAGSPSFVVWVSPQSALADVFTQRVRWASKTSKYVSTSSKVIAAVVGFVNVAIPVGLLLSLTNSNHWIPWLTLYLGKTAVDTLVLTVFSQRYKLEISLFRLIPQALAHPFYSAVIVLASIIRPRYSWKGRQASPGGFKP